MTVRTYISIITLHVNELNAPTKRHRMDTKKKKKTKTYAVYKRPTSVLGAHTDWKREDGRKYSRQTEIKSKLGQQHSY